MARGGRIPGGRRRCGNRHGGDPSLGPRGRSPHQRLLPTCRSGSRIGRSTPGRQPLRPAGHRGGQHPPPARWCAGSPRTSWARTSPPRRPRPSRSAVPTSRPGRVDPPARRPWWSWSTAGTVPPDEPEPGVIRPRTWATALCTAIPGRGGLRTEGTEDGHRWAAHRQPGGLCGATASRCGCRSTWTCKRIAIPEEQAAGHLGSAIAGRGGRWVHPSPTAAAAHGRARGLGGGADGGAQIPALRRAGGALHRHLRESEKKPPVRALVEVSPGPCFRGAGGIQERGDYFRGRDGDVATRLLPGKSRKWTVRAGTVPVPVPLAPPPRRAKVSTAWEGGKRRPASPATQDRHQIPGDLLGENRSPWRWPRRSWPVGAASPGPGGRCSRRAWYMGVCFMASAAASPTCACWARISG